VPVKLSIIIPVYRVEATLDRCVESALNQNLDDFEVILVDDDSPDNCPKMCDAWARRDTHIQVIHKQNGGLSDARNAGLDQARGDYITFVDSDDYLAPDTYPALLAKIGDADILEFSIAGKPPFQDRIYTNKNDYWLKAQAYTHTYACNKIYRRVLFNGIRFPKGKVFEDVYTLPLLLDKAQTIATTSSGFYQYCYNPHGITANADGAALAQLLDAHLTSHMPIDDTYYTYLLNIQMDVWEQTGAPVTLPVRHLDASHLKGKNKMKAVALNLIGIKKLCIINKVIHLVKKPSRW